MSAPKGGGAVQSIGEKFSANAATGTASLGVPIATSPGRGGFDLGLGLHYDSGAGNGPFGVGWQLSVPSITRKTDKGLPRYLDDGDESDVFILSGAEDLVPVHGARKTASRARGALSACALPPARRERRSPGSSAGRTRETGNVHWRTTTGDNVTSFFGRSKRRGSSTPSIRGSLFSWLLEETRDDRGNVVRYTYKAEDGTGVDRGAAASRAASSTGSSARRPSAT